MVLPLGSFFSDFYKIWRIVFIVFNNYSLLFFTFPSVKNLVNASSAKF